MKNYDAIILKEIRNSGKAIYVYKIPYIGIYVSFGLSAFHAAHYIHTTISYSDELLLPVAIFREYEFFVLKNKVKKVDYDDGAWTFHMSDNLNYDNYGNWIDSVKEERKTIISQPI
ncbi:MAG: hypothetical protein ILA25_06580 [Prevotella sp.]|nr:hypothetical protein [Prevotella sp.]